MINKIARICLVAFMSSMLVTPSYARGGGFGRMGGMGGGMGGRFGGGRNFGGMRGGEMNNAFRGQSGGFGSMGRQREFGGGFNSLSQSRPMSRPSGEGGFANAGSNFGRGEGGFANAGNAFGRGEGGFANGGSNFGRGFPNSGNLSGRQMPSQLPTDGGWGRIAGNENRTPAHIGDNQLRNQGDQIRNSFNNNQFHNNQFNQNNNYNVNRYGGYGGYGSGWAHGYAASNAYHGYWGYPGGWYCPGWSEATAWTCMGLTTLTSFLGLGMMASASSNKSSASPTNITYQGDTVYINGQPNTSAQSYYQQAMQLANQGSTYSSSAGYPAYASGGYDQTQQMYQQAGFTGGGTASTAAPATSDASSTSTGEEWQPLGVFGLAEPGQSDTNMLLQLAINKQGVVRGNYMNQLTNERSQVFGSLDKKTQRISWKIGENSDTVFDTSLSDIVKNDSEVLVHYGPTNTREMALVRLPAPSNAGGSSAPAQGPAGSPNG